MTAFPFIEKEYGIRAVWRPLGQGHIHETYRSEDGLYVLQHINTFVFCDVQGLMENISRFTAFMRKKLKEIGIDHLKVVYSKEPAIRPREEGRTPGSVSFVPSAAGLVIAGEVIRDLCYN